MSDLCLARTGLLPDAGLGKCRYHLCVEPEGHRSDDFTHLCSCGHRWTCLTGSVSELIKLLGGER